jgi:hypothetical protein
MTERPLNLQLDAVLPGVDAGVISLVYNERPDRQIDGSLRMKRYFELIARGGSNPYRYSSEQICAKLADAVFYLTNINPLKDKIRRLRAQIRQKELRMQKQVRKTGLNGGGINPLPQPTVMSGMPERAIQELAAILA